MTYAVSIAQGGSNNTTFRNRIINGAMVIDQRNAGAASTNTVTGYWLDRWRVDQSTTGKLIVQQNAGSVTPPTGFTNYFGATSQSAYAGAAGDIYAFNQYIEGYNTSDLGWGAAGASSVTLSFWVRSSLTGTQGGSIQNEGRTRSYPYTYTINSANTWEYKTVTIPGDTTGTWATNNGIGIRVFFNLGTGSTYSGTAGSWAGADYRGASGCVSVVGTNGATFYITGVQLEAGTTATPFEYRQYGTEWALCQRYYVSYTTSGTPILVGQANTATISYINAQVAMRASPTVTYNAINVNDAAIASAVTAASIDGFFTNSIGIKLTASGLTSGRAAMVTGTGATSYLALSAEL